MKKADIGLIGLAVMGENLATEYGVQGLHRGGVQPHDGKGGPTLLTAEPRARTSSAATAWRSWSTSLATPRKVFMMVKAGQAVDDMIDQLLPLLDDGDILIDGGNSHFPDTIRRTAVRRERRASCYVGTGVSGGEEGALNGPSMMPGGSPAAWPYVKPIFQAICAKVEDGSPCCDWVGENGAGHFVKMVHNGIEYGDMQLICEAYQLMRDLLRHERRRDARGVRRVEQDGAGFSYLIEITRDILAYKDTDGAPDRGENPGHRRTEGHRQVDRYCRAGRGRAADAHRRGGVRALPVRDEGRTRQRRQRHTAAPIPAFTGDKAAMVEAIRQALYASKIISYAQGYTLMRTAAKTYGWNLNYGGIALMWRGGCIIRSVFLGKIKEAYDKNPELSNLLLDPYFEDDDRGAGPRVARPSRRLRCSYGVSGTRR